MVLVRSDPSGAPRSVAPEELRAEGGSVAVDARTEVALDAREPFTPIGAALVARADVRDALARGILVPSLRGLERVRLAVGIAAAFPLLFRLELDRELLASGNASAGRLLGDGVLVAFVARELGRRTPRFPRIAAASILAVGLQWVVLALRSCGHGVHLAVWAAAALALGAGGAWLFRAPAPQRLALELAGRIGLSRLDLTAAGERAAPPVPDRLVGVAVAAAVGLPVLLFVTRRAGVTLPGQAALLVAYGGIVPEVVGRAFPPARASRAHVKPLAIALAASAGLTAAMALAGGGDQFMKAGIELARCTGRLDADTRRLAASHAAELAEAITRVRASTWLALTSIAVVPLAEERVYRGVLLPILVRRYGTAYGLFAASLVFGVAHAGVYELALWQTGLLGLAFGVAYLEGGIVAAFATHALWNLLQIA